MKSKYVKSALMLLLTLEAHINDFQNNWREYIDPEKDDVEKDLGDVFNSIEKVRNNINEEKVN